MKNNFSQPPTVKVVAYARCSTLLNQTPESQLVHIREFCKSRGYDLIEEYVDVGISGAQERRPALDRLMADGKRAQYSIVICAALDRVSRSTKHFLNLFEELRHYKISIISLRENLDFTSPTGIMVASVLASVATLERSIISERIKQSLAARKLAAQKTGSSWRCGRKPLSKDITQKVRDLRVQQKSIREISRLLGIGKTSVERILKRDK